MKSVTHIVKASFERSSKKRSWMLNFTAPDLLEGNSGGWVNSLRFV